MPGSVRRLPHPLACFHRSVTRGSRSLDSLPRSYVYGNNPALGAFERFAERARTTAGCRYVELATGHNLKDRVPRARDDILLAIASEMD